MRKTVITLALVSLPPIAAVAAAEESPQVYERHYELDFLNPRTAVSLARNQCSAAATPRQCRIHPVTFDRPGGVVSVTADAATHERVAAIVSERDVPPRTHSFQLTLLRATRTDGGTPDGLPEPVRTALDDVASFLPYEGYEILDSAFLRSAMSGRVEVSGPGDKTYAAHLGFRAGESGADGELFVHRFVLEPVRRARTGTVGPAEPRAPRRPEAPDGPDSPRSPTAPEAKSPERPDRPARRTAPARPVAPRRAAVAPSATPPVLSTSFSISPGETAVVGTSKLGGGDSALVVLLTAVP